MIKSVADRDCLDKLFFSLAPWQRKDFITKEEGNLNSA